MIPFDLRRWFRVRMVPLVATAAVVVAVAAPLSHHLAKRRELWREARAAADRVAVVLHDEIEERPLLWRYDVPKLAERLSAEGLSSAARVVIHDSDGVAVPVPLEVPPGRASRGLVWGRSEVVVLGRPAATVWVAADAAPLWAGTAWLAAAFALLAALLAAVLYLVPMRAIAAAQRRIQALLGQLAQTLQEEDRRRIARDLHDGVGGVLTAARLRLMALGRSGGSAPAKAGALDELARLLDEAIGEVRRSAYALTPPVLGELGLAGALGRHCEAFAAATGLSVRCEVDPGLGALPAPLETACYRIVQEALSNTARHAGAARAFVRLQRAGGALRLSISDDGTAQGAQTEGLGLAGIQERARLLGGSAEITAAPGVRIEVHLPIEIA